MNALKRALALALLLFVWAPCLVVWAILGIPVLILGGAAAVERSFEIVGWPYERWIRPLLLAGQDE
jgi:hypothetical protein